MRIVPALSTFAVTALLLAGAAIPASAQTATPTPQILLSKSCTTQPCACDNIATIEDVDSHGNPVPNAVIYYSDNGKDPVQGNAGTSNFAQTGPFEVIGPGLVTIIAQALTPSLPPSLYVIDTFACPAAPPEPDFSPNALPPPNQSCPVTVQISDSAAGNTLFVSENGQAPSDKNNIYDGASPTSVTLNPGGTGATTLEAVDCTPVGLCSAVNEQTYICSNPPSVATYDTMSIEIQTGNDNADQNLEILANLSSQGKFCLKASNDTSLPSTCANNSNHPTWSNGQVIDTGRIKIASTPQQLSAFTGQTLQIQSIQGSCGLSCSNWDIQAITVTLTNSQDTRVPAETVLNAGSVINSGWTSSNCIARLKAPPNATTVQFSLDGSSTGTYVDGNESGQVATCTDNGDGGTPP